MAEIAPARAIPGIPCIGASGLGSQERAEFFLLGIVQSDGISNLRRCRRPRFEASQKIDAVVPERNTQVHTVSIGQARRTEHERTLIPFYQRKRETLQALVVVAAAKQ